MKNVRGTVWKTEVNIGGRTHVFFVIAKNMASAIPKAVAVAETYAKDEGYTNYKGEPHKLTANDVTKMKRLGTLFTAGM